MKTLSITFLSLFIFIYLAGCSSGYYTVSDNGDKAKVELKDGKIFEGELVTILDTAIIFETVSINPSETTNLFYTLNKDIKSIEVLGYDGSGWAAPVLLLQVLPAGLMAGAVASTEVSDVNPLVVGFIFAIPAIITSILFSASKGETPQWNESLSLEAIESLNIYARYPQDSESAEIDNLIKKLNQKEIKKYINYQNGNKY